MNGSAVLIGVDWGTSSFRAYQVDGDGKVVARLEQPLGVLQIQAGEFEAAFRQLLDPWLSSPRGLPIVACGMIGSRQGWREAPYVECPARPAEIAARMMMVEFAEGRKVHIVPGLSHVDDAGIPDVMRGEETQIIGELPGETPATQLLILPGTHSKWALIADGGIREFATFMTGELFETLRNHSILGRIMEGEAEDSEAFRRGVEQAARPGGLSKHLFSARSLPLLGRLNATGTCSYLSGLLIGAEIAAGMAWLSARGFARQAITVSGSDTLMRHYINALEINGMQPRRGSGEAAARGLLRIARLKRLL